MRKYNCELIAREIYIAEIYDSWINLLLFEGLEYIVQLCIGTLAIFVLSTCTVIYCTSDIV